MKIWRILSIALMFNFIVWSCSLLFIGGTAVDGRKENNIYYIDGRMGEVKVTAKTYYYSLFHTYFIYISGPILVFSLLKSREKEQQ